MSNSEFPKGVEPIVGPYIINDNNQVLLVKSFKWPDKWIILGGHIEPGETIKAALKREAKEEIGLDIEVLDVIHVGELIGRPPEHHRYAHYVFIDSVAKITGGEYKLNEELSEYRWFDIFEDYEDENIIHAVREGTKKLREWLGRQKG